MKHHLAGLFFLVILTLAQAGCHRTGRSSNILRVGASPVPHAAILEQLKPALAQEGITLEIVEMTDYVQPNLALTEADLDANFFQHQPYLDAFNRGGAGREKLVPLAKVHVEPLGIYSKKARTLAELGPGAVIAIPNDPTNATRALELLEAAGVLHLSATAKATASATVQDVVAEPKAPKLRELDGAQLPRVLSDVDAAVINTNYALEAGLTPSRDALAREDATSRYANLLVARADHANDPRLLALSRELTSETTRRFIAERFRGSLVPAF
ncbi:MAG: metQ [Labilithrix sp.]|nr:metQ [Labilithrix sp.]